MYAVKLDRSSPVKFAIQRSNLCLHCANEAFEQACRQSGNPGRRDSGSHLGTACASGLHPTPQHTVCASASTGLPMPGGLH